MRAGQRESSSSFLKIFILQSTGGGGGGGGERGKKKDFVRGTLRRASVFHVHLAPETVLSVKCVHRMTDIINLAKRK